MEENTNQVQEQTAVETEGKTFSQEDVNRIVGERLAKEKAKNESDWQQREQDLQKRELRMTAKEYLNEKHTCGVIRRTLLHRRRNITKER